MVTGKTVHALIADYLLRHGLSEVSQLVGTLTSNAKTRA